MDSTCKHMIDVRDCEYCNPNSVMALKKRLEEAESRADLHEKNAQQKFNMWLKAEAFIKDTGELPDEWIKLTDSDQVSPTEARGMGTCIDQLKAKLKEHGYG